MNPGSALSPFLFSLVIEYNKNKLGEVEGLKYLKSELKKDGGFKEDMKYIIKCGWTKWSELLNILCNKRIPIRSKSKFYKTLLVRAAMMYGSEC